MSINSLRIPSIARLEGFSESTPQFAPSPLSCIRSAQLRLPCAFPQKQIREAWRTVFEGFQDFSRRPGRKNFGKERKDPICDPDAFLRPASLLQFSNRATGYFRKITSIIVIIYSFFICKKNPIGYPHLLKISQLDPSTSPPAKART